MRAKGILIPPTSDRVYAFDITRAMRVIQFADSMFPVGSFSFSSGLESAVAQGVVNDVSTLREFVLTATHQAATCDGIALIAAHRAAVSGEYDGVLAADRAVLSRKLNEEARTMSARMGKKLAELSDQLDVSGWLKGRWLLAIEAGDTPGTYPVGLGIVFAEMGSPEQDAFAVHHYGVANTVLGAALRLLRVDHFATQQILLEVNNNAVGEYATVAGLTLDDMASFTPMADILAAVHVRSHVRMFMN